ncbi:DUF4192 domain-containing protein [Nocardia sp. CA-151230]|uniref:DUF4192 domain-containing protein n=1 Tax=Nocardia sp. CA-151230 TaxID=3239982 RepID=UPI003D90EC66
MPLPVSISDPGDLIAAVPALLGFTPTRSLVLLFLSHDTPDAGAASVHAVIRTESPLQQIRLSDNQIGQSAIRACLCAEAFAVLAILIDDRVSRPTEASPIDERWRSALDALRQNLESKGLTLAGAWGVGSIATNAQWWDELAPEHHGHLPDPAASLVAAELIGTGRQIHHTRTELTALVEIDVALRDHVTAALPEAAADAHRRLARTARIGDPDAYTRQALWQVMHVIKHVSILETPAPRALADVAVALRDTAVRDVMFGVAAGEYAARAEHLWSILTRALPDTDRAEAATLFAFHAYRRGDGVLAGIALDTALSCDPEHRMAHLLGIALSNALPPQRLHRLCRAGIRAATELRVDIGAAEPDSHTADFDHDRS